MKDLNSIRFLSSEMYFTILDNAWSFWLALRQILFIWYSNQKLLSIYIPNNFSQLLLLIGGTFDIDWNRVIRRKKHMAFGSICFKVVETEQFKHFFCSYLKVIHDFIKCRSSLVRSGILSQVCKVWTIVLKKCEYSGSNCLSQMITYTELEKEML